MCGIAFAKGAELHKVLGRQRERGLDGVGMSFHGIIGHKGFHPDRDDKGHFISEKTRFDWYVDFIKETVAKGNLQEKYGVFHHRKGSVGRLSLDNTHPFTTKKFSIMQNGTERLLRQWGDVEGIPSDRTDTYCLAQFLQQKANNLEEIIDILDRFKERVVDIGVLLIVERKTNRILFYSDGNRESYITFNKDDNKIDMIESWHGINRSICHKNIGSIIFDFEGNIISNNIEKENEEYKAKTSTSAYTDDEGMTKYMPWESRSSAATIALPAAAIQKGKEKVEKIKEDANSIFKYNVRRAINQGDISLKEIRDVPLGYLINILRANELKKFKKTYEQAIRRAISYDLMQSESAKEGKRDILKEIAGKTDSSMGDAAATANKEANASLIERQIHITTTANSVMSDLDVAVSTVESLFMDEEDKKKNKPTYAEDKDMPPTDPTFIPTDKHREAEQDAYREAMYGVSKDEAAKTNYYKFQEFFDTVDWIDDVASFKQLNENIDYVTQISKIDVTTGMVTLERSMYLRTASKEVPLKIDSSTNSYGVYDELNRNQFCLIKVHAAKCKPILIPYDDAVIDNIQ